MKKGAKVVQSIPVNSPRFHGNAFHYPWHIYSNKLTIPSGIKLLGEQQAFIWV